MNPIYFRLIGKNKSIHYRNVEIILQIFFFFVESIRLEPEYYYIYFFIIAFREKKKNWKKGKDRNRMKAFIPFISIKYKWYKIISVIHSRICFTKKKNVSIRVFLNLWLVYKLASKSMIKISFLSSKISYYVKFFCWDMKNSELRFTIEANILMWRSLVFLLVKVGYNFHSLCGLKLNKLVLILLHL